MGDSAEGDPDIETFYEVLLRVGTSREPLALIARALALIVEASNAELGYVELRSLREPHRRASLSNPAGTNVELGLSIDILGLVIESGVPYTGPNPNARDPDNAGQHANIVVVPIEVGVGAIYLQARRGLALDDQTRRRMEHFARLVQPVAARLVGERSLQEETLSYERRRVLEALERTSWNITATAEELRVARQSMYPLLRRLRIDLR